MGLLFMDGFDYYSSSAPTSLNWTGTTSIDYVTTGRFGGRSLKSNGRTHRALASAKSSLSLGFAFWSNVDFSSGTQRQIVSFRNTAGGTTQCSLAISNANKFNFCLGAGETGSPTILDITSTATFVNGVWTYIGIELVRHASSGSFNVYQDGVKILGKTGVNTGGSDIGGVGLECNTGSGYALFDDVYCVDGSTWIGEARISSARPAADTAQKDWVPNSGSTNYSRVNETTVDGDTSYVSASAVDAKDLYELSTLGYTPNDIFGIQNVIVARKDDAATRTIAPVTLSGSTETVGASKAMSTSYTTALQLLDQNPDTSTPWTPSDIADLQVGMKVTA